MSTRMSIIFDTHPVWLYNVCSDSLSVCHIMAQKKRYLHHLFEVLEATWHKWPDDLIFSNLYDSAREVSSCTVYTQYRVNSSKLHFLNSCIGKYPSSLLWGSELGLNELYFWLIEPAIDKRCILPVVKVTAGEQAVGWTERIIFTLRSCWMSIAVVVHKTFGGREGQNDLGQVSVHAHRRKL